MQKLTYLSPLLAVLFLAGCGLLFRSEAPLRHYTLGVVSPQEATNTNSNVTGLSVGLQRLTLANHLDTHFLVVRRGDHEIAFADHHRWAGELRREINEAVAGYLAAHDLFVRADTAPWPNRAEYDYVIQIHVARFEGETARPTDEARVQATWRIIAPADGEVIDRGTTDFRQSEWTAGDYPGLVRMLDEGLYALSDDLAERLEYLAAREAIQSSDS